MHAEQLVGTGGCHEQGFVVFTDLDAIRRSKRVLFSGMLRRQRFQIVELWASALRYATDSRDLVQECTVLHFRETVFLRSGFPV